MLTTAPLLQFHAEDNDRHPQSSACTRGASWPAGVPQVTEASEVRPRVLHAEEEGWLGSRVQGGRHGLLRSTKHKAGLNWASPNCDRESNTDGTSHSVGPPGLWSVIPG